MGGMADTYRSEGSDAPLPSPPPPSIRRVCRKHRRQTPQETVDDFWDKFTTKFPGKIHTILPQDNYAKSKARHTPKGAVHGQAALKGYEQAKADCQAAVDKIANECRRVNMRYRDPHFDIEFDLKQNSRARDCLEGFGRDDEPFEPGSVKRVPEIFETPQFYIEGATASDVRQGNDGDCWFLSALCALGNKEGLIDRVCVARDEKVGVYGFVFHQDGEWIQTVIDDKLYLNVPDYDESKDEKFNWDKVFNRQDAEEEYRKAYQTGSRALYFAQCSNENETWLPLLEKAFAKAHGDYRAIYGGFTGEAIEDLTGGVTTELFTTDILDKDRFWNDEIMKVNKEFLFGCATGCFDNWKNGARYTDRKGVVSMHAYSIMEAREVKGKRLLRIRNPWGKTEWQGAWSDGSEEWTPEWMELLQHKFGNDGIFWISYEDILRKYQSFDRTRLFGPEWTVTQRWTTVDVPWTADYNDTKFSVTLEKKGPIVIVLSQLDDRYYRGLEGQYRFSLHFRLEKDGEDDYIVRSHGNYLMRRSVSTDLELEAGTYSVLMRITAQRYSDIPTPEQTIRENCRWRQEKLLRIGLAYDLAHARGQVNETEQEAKLKAQRDQKKNLALRKKQREEVRARMYKDWLINKKIRERNHRRRLREEEHRRKKAEARKTAKTPEKTTNSNTAAEDANISAVNIPDAGPAQQTNEPVLNNSEFKLEEQATGGATHIDPVESPVVAANLPSPPAETTETQTNTIDQPSGKDETTQARIDKFNKDLQSVPSVRINNDNHPASNANEDHADNSDHSISDSCSVLSFVTSIDSDLDLESLPSHTDQPSDPLPRPNRHPADMGHSDDENEDFVNDPWNAVCVVGLRVFSKDSGVCVEVVRPKNGEDEDGEEEETPLDLDDPSKRISEMVEDGAEEEGGHRCKKT
ncbi:MAG: hypothetical protein Q9187_003520 [Circinaria calcarea]